MSLERRPRRLPALSAALIVAVLAVVGPTAGARAAPETFNTALPVARGEFVLREQFLYKRATDDPGPADREVTVLGGVSVLGYGVTPDLAVFGALPYLDKRLDLTLPDGSRVGRNTNGIGDARLFGRYTLYKDNFPGGSFRVAPFAGVELPTGENDDGDALGRLPATLQLGSGSWDPFAGVVATYQVLDYQIDVQAAYKFNTEADGFEFGDEARFDASLQYRLWPFEVESDTDAFLYGVLETNLIYKGRNEAAGVDDPNSGGTALFLAPGLQYVTTRWIVEAIVQVPVFQGLNGNALQDDYVVRAGFRVNF